MFQICQYESVKVNIGLVKRDGIKPTDDYLSLERQSNNVAKSA